MVFINKIFIFEAVVAVAAAWPWAVASAVRLAFASAA